MIKVQIFFLALMYLSPQIGHSQKCFQSLTFEEFLNLKVENDTNFVKQVYRNVRYSKEAIKNEMQGIAEIMLINHNEKKMEIIVMNPNSGLFQNVTDEIKLVINKVNIKRSDPFFTRFFINFDLDGDRYPRKEFNKFHLGLINNNMITIIDYIVPRMDRH